MSVGARVAIVAALATLASSVTDAAHTTAAASSVGTASTANTTAAPRVAGTACAKLGLRRTVKGVSYVCTRTGSGSSARLRWTAGAATTKSTTTTTLPAPTLPALASGDREACRLRDQSAERARRRPADVGLVVGFPRIETNFPPAGRLGVALIPIDFADLPGEADPVGRVQTQMTRFSDWWDMVSEGRVGFDWRVHRTWVRVPGSAADYALNRSRSDDNRLARAAFAAADPVFDFTGITSVHFLLPKAQTFMAESVQGFLHSEFGQSDGGYRTAEGRIVNYTVVGTYFDQQYRTYWSYWAHETGHMFPLPDLYDHRGQWWNGTILPIPIGPFSGYDMMSSQDGPSRTLSAWLRWIMAWLSDAQVWCNAPAAIAAGGPVELSLAPIDSRTGTPRYKAAMIPISSSRLLVVESRRTHLDFDCPRVTRNGVIVYTVTTTTGHGEGIQALVAPTGRGLVYVTDCNSPQQLDAVLGVGDSVTAEGITVRVTASGAWDTVRISAAG